MYLYKRVASPVGILTLVAEGPALTAILWQNERPGRVRLGPMREAKDDPVLTSTECQLSEYFTGGRERFDLPLAFSGTEFQKRYGTPCSASRMARLAPTAILPSRLANQLLFVP